MMTQYVEAVTHALSGILNLFTRLALPFAIGLGLMVVAVTLAFLFPRDSLSIQNWDWRRGLLRASGYAVTGLTLMTGWAVLRTVLPLARESIQWRESAEATTNPTPDASAVTQFGPAVAAMREHTYTRSLTLPPEFFQRLGTEGLGVLAPYLSDPSAQNVLRLVDTFRRSGSDVVFTRQVTRLDEEPIPFTTSQVQVKFRRMPGRAYDADFEGRYTFANSGTEPITARFLFPLPNASTIRDLYVAVGGQIVTEPNDAHNYEWKSTLAPGERREAVVHYRVVGSQTWHYDLGSQRRRVQQFRLDVASGGQVRFLRGSLQPALNTNSALRWELSNVVTAQQIALSFPPDIVGRESYLQALSALPATLALFLLAMMLFGVRMRLNLPPVVLAASLALFAFGLGMSPILANYVGFIAGILIGSLAAAFLALRLLGKRFLLAALPVALLPAACLSPRHTGLLALLLALFVLAGLMRGGPYRR